jgi:hypothetical protein
MHGFPVDVRAEFWPQGFVRDQIDRASQKVFEIKLDAEVTRRTGRAIESDQYVDIAVRACGVAYCRAKQGKIHDAVTVREFAFMLFE